MCVLRTFHLFNAFPARTVAAVSPSASENKKTQRASGGLSILSSAVWWQLHQCS